MKKTKLTRSLMAACSIVALSVVMYGCAHDGGDPPAATTPMPPPPTISDVTMDVDVSGVTAQARLLAVLPESGTSDTIMIEAGGSATRGSGLGVTFTCDSAYPCTVTVTNSLGTILASVTTQMDPDGTEPTVMASLPDPVDTFAVLNDGSAVSIRALMGNPAAPGGTPAVAAPTLTPTELIGMGIGGPGVLDASMAGLRSDFQANGAALTDVGGNTPPVAAGPGLSPLLRMGTTITGATDAISGGDIASAPDGWVMKTLFRDWGDTAGDGDGGFETGAIVVKNLGEGTPHPFDRALYLKYAIPAAQSMFRLSVTADGTVALDSLATSVDIDSAATPTNTNAATATARQWAEMIFDGDSLVGAQSQDNNVNASETFTGTYFGASGQFQCVAATGANCGIMRNADGDVVIIDTDATTPGIQGGGRWTFTPDPDAMIDVPDQDWMAYGAWLTTPDNGTGNHRLGVFFNGLDTWAPATDALTATTNNALRGSATYSGGATGVYVDGADSGLFTADAALTATFDKNSTATNVDADDYMISGRIDNFRGTNGVFLGDDTQASPNDPDAGGENDWVVVLGAFDFQATTDGSITATATTGSADGVSWTGSWNGQFFGPSGTQTAPLAPSGVAGQFWAQTPIADADVATTPHDETTPVTAVVGAFGATKDE